MKFTEVASMVACQKTTASGRPGKSATLRSIADGSFNAVFEAGQRYNYKRFCRLISLKPLCSTAVTGNIQVCCFKLSKVSFSLFCSIKYVQVMPLKGGEGNISRASCRSAINNVLKVEVSGTSYL
jgi:hypothetical protein